MEQNLPKVTTRKIQRSKTGLYVNFPMLLSKHYQLKGEELIKFIPQSDNKLVIEIIKVD